MSNANDSQRVNIVAAFSLAVLSFILLIPIVNSITIPLESDRTDIVSLATNLQISPFTSYVKFLVLLLIPSLVAVTTLNFKLKLNRYWKVITNTSVLIFNLSNASFYPVFIFILVFLWAVNKNYQSLNWTLTDAFHEGEYLGFLPNFLTLDKPYLKSFMVHGFGLDVLTSLIASKLADSSNVIALTRFFRMTQGTIGYLGCYWIIWEIICSVKFKAVKKINVFFLSSVLFTILDGSYFYYFTDVFAGRDTFFILQLALTVRLFRLLSTRSQIRNPLIPATIGISIPVSLLYVYDRAAYFILIYAFACILSLGFGRRFFFYLISRSILGIVIGLISIAIVLGIEQFTEIFLQIFFWVRAGRYISFNVMPGVWFDSSLLWVRFSLAILTQILAVIYLVLEYKSIGLKTFIRNKCLALVLLFASLIYMRIVLDRPDNANYAGSASLISVLLLIYLLINIFSDSLEAISRLQTEPLFKWTALISIALAMLLHPVLNPLFALDKFNQLYFTYRITDEEIVDADYLKAANTVKPEVERSPCFFTLNQQGLWYYLFNKPSCSKFSIVYYARTTDAQKTLIQDLDTYLPTPILFGSSYTNTFEGIPISDGIPIIYQYILSHYKPDVVASSQWFWQRNEEKFSFLPPQPHNYGRIDAVDEKIFKGKQVSLSGTSTTENQTDAVYLTYGEDNQIIEVARVDELQWKLPIPTISLPVGKNVLRVWSYAVGSDRLVQIGEDIKINLVDRSNLKSAT